MAKEGKYKVRQFKFPAKIQDIKIVEQEGPYPKVAAIGGCNFEVETEITDFEDIIFDTTKKSNIQGLKRKFAEGAAKGGGQAIITAALTGLFTLI